MIRTAPSPRRLARLVPVFALALFANACASDGVDHQSPLTTEGVPLVGGPIATLNDAVTATLNEAGEIVTGGGVAATGTPASPRVVVTTNNGQTPLFWANDENGVPRLTSTRLTPEERRIRRLAKRGMPPPPEVRQHQRQTAHRVGLRREAYRVNGVR